MSYSKFKIEWSKDQLSTLFLDWLDDHPRERAVLFAPREGSRPGPTTLTKSICAARAAEFLFADSEWEREDPKYLAKSVYNRICQLRVKYEKFNKKIGRSATNLAYEEIEDRALVSRIRKLMVQDKFPEWIRLHAYWRTLPHLNQFYPDVAHTKKSELPKPRARTKTPLPSRPNRLKMLTAGTTIRRRTLKIEATAPKSITRDSTPEIICDSDPLLEVSDTPEHTAPVQGYQDSISISQVQQLELQIQLRKLELEAEEKRNAVELQRAQIEAESLSRRQDERHEIAKLFAFAAVGAGMAVLLCNK